MKARIRKPAMPELTNEDLEEFLVPDPPPLTADDHPTMRPRTGTVYSNTRDKQINPAVMGPGWHAHMAHTIIAARRGTEVEVFSDEQLVAAYEIARALGKTSRVTIVKVKPVPYTIREHILTDCPNHKLLRI